ncbi:uncharacterized protein [Asterias amurensis]|uniref:uncharacterized protein n=1 Tax=Asterias amurensis TaxID=7602 RepID=UPI003AB49EB9
MLDVVVLQFFVQIFPRKYNGCRMPALPRNPSSMTKERLAEELRRNNISLPSGRSKKEVYVELYKQHLLDNPTSPQLTAYRNMSVNTSPKIGFSSDEEDEIVQVQKKTRKPNLNTNNNRRTPRKQTKKLDKRLFEDRLAEVEELSDGDLRKELEYRGFKAGPITASTRAVYERKLADVLTKPEKEEEPEENGDSPEEEMKNGYSDSDIDENDSIAVAPEEPQEQPLELQEQPIEPQQQPVEQYESTRTRSQTTEVVYSESTTRQRSTIQKSQVETVSSEKTQEGTEASSKKTGERGKPLVPIWLQLVIFAIITAFLVLIWYNMETSQTDPALLS